MILKKGIFVIHIFAFLSLISFGLPFANTALGDEWSEAQLEIWNLEKQY